MKFKNKIIVFLLRNGATSIDELATKLNVSRQYIHRLINELIDENKISKMGTAPQVFYKIIENQEQKNEFVDFEKEQFLNEHFLIVNALGEKLEGLEAMKYWCQNQNLPLQKTIDEYIETRKKYLDFYNAEHLINGLEKLKNTKGITEIGVDELYYLDFYAIERFGKTRLGTLMHFAKQGQNKALMQIIVSEIRNRLMYFIEKHQIEAVLFVPPTIARKTQIMDYLQKKLDLGLPLIKVKKISNAIVIPQKALSKLFERVANARNTFIVPDQQAFSKILIIDDAIGSGATTNEIALKLKQKKIANHIIGLAISGNLEGFEVISEL